MANKSISIYGSEGLIQDMPKEPYSLNYNTVLSV